jgi:proton glutamate symport protein
MGIGILFTLGKLVVLMYLGLIVFAILVVGGVSVLIRVPFFTFMRAIKGAVPDRIHHGQQRSRRCPKALEVMERFGCPEEHRRPGACRPGTASIWTARRCTCHSASVFVAQLFGRSDDSGPAAGHDADA